MRDVIPTLAHGEKMKRGVVIGYTYDASISQYRLIVDMSDHSEVVFLCRSKRHDNGEELNISIDDRVRWHGGNFIYLSSPATNKLVIPRLNEDTRSCNWDVPVRVIAIES